MAGATFEEAIGVLASAGDAVTLRFSRGPSQSVAVCFPGDRWAFGAPGDTLEVLALSAGYRPGDQLWLPSRALWILRGDDADKRPGADVTGVL